MDTEHQHHHEYVIHVSGRRVEFDIERPTARRVLDQAKFVGQFCLAATHGEGGKVIKNFTDDEHVDLKEYKHFRATYCGPEVVS
jgi:hypothetical protein